MNTTVKALLDLYVKLGGNLTDTYDTIADGAAVGNYTLIPDCIEAVTKKASTGGGTTITVDSALDADSTNPVQNKVIYSALGGKAGTGDLPFVVTADYNTSNETIENASATLAQVLEASAAGKTVLFSLTTNISGADMVQTLEASKIISADGAGLAQFTASFTDDEDGTEIVSIGASSTVSDGAWQLQYVLLMPPYSNAESGKVLGVNSDGELDWVTPQ